MSVNSQSKIKMFNTREQISDEHIRQLAPSAFASRAMGSVSDKYSFIPTIEVIGAMRKAGWIPVHAMECPIRQKERTGFQRHMIRFWRGNQTPVAGEYMPEVNLVNSHDGSSAYTLPVGLWKFSCSNGLMVDEGIVPTIRVRHSHVAATEVVDASLLALDQMPKISGEVDRMRVRTLTTDELARFAEQALKLRYDDVNDAPVGASLLLNVRRTDDIGTNLWSVFNRVQENLTMGGLVDYAKRNTKGHHHPKTRPVLGLTQNVQLNKELWGITKSFLNN